MVDFGWKTEQKMKRLLSFEAMFRQIAAAVAVAVAVAVVVVVAAAVAVAVAAALLAG